MANCRVCSRDGVRDQLDLGPQALTNRFLTSPEPNEYLHPCRFGVCRLCGTLQLESAVPVDEMRPRFDWIMYNEPETHLDEVATAIVQLPGINAGSKFGGISYKDESTLKRLNRLGFPDTWLAHIRDDLGVESPFGGIESLQDRMTLETADGLVAKFGQPDVLLFRHVLEHSYDIREVLRALRAIVRPGGYVVIEAPDAVKALDRFDYTTIWEEHLVYFTPATLGQCFAASGFEVVSLKRFYYSQEDVLVAVIRSVDQPQHTPLTEPELVTELDRADRFIQTFPKVRERIRNRVAGVARAGGKVAMLGAGHLSAAYINFYGLEDVIDFVADDNSKKHGLFMPGSQVPILPSSELVNRDIQLCLMSVRAEVEDLVVGKNAAFTARGGVLASVFPESKYSLDKIGTLARKTA